MDPTSQAGRYRCRGNQWDFLAAGAACSVPTIPPDIAALYVGRVPDASLIGWLGLALTLARLPPSDRDKSECAASPDDAPTKTGMRV
ncbi:hypothetical protein ACFSKJ_23845 [Tabrizicola soli]|uniref:hypothetical protein n=1 Tax=Tabrizicola soli TaxID=2185115 RepID=UPI00363FAE13